MPGEPHLSDEILLLLTTGELSDDERRHAERHLGDCAACHERYDGFSSLREGLRTSLDRRAEQTFRNRLAPPPRKRRWLWNGAAAAAVVAVLLYSVSTPRLSAQEVLQHAARAEREQNAAPRLVRVRANGESCAWYPPQQTAFDSACGTVQQRLRDASWDWRNPLSAGVYRAWHDGLTAKNDSVRQSNGLTMVSTETEQGPIRVAQLTLGTVDYQAKRLLLDVRGGDRIEILEEPAPLHARSVKSPSTESAKEDGPADNPADVAEVEAWTMLARLDLLDGWHATVRRSGGRVDALVLADGASPRLTRAAAQLAAAGGRMVMMDAESPDVNFAPQRDPGGPMEALTSRSLASLLPVGTDAADFKNRALLASRTALGLASVRNRMSARRTALAGCSCAGRFNALLDEQSRKLRTATAELGELLEPLLGPPPSTRLLTTTEAERLDSEVIHLFFRAPEGRTTAAALDIIRASLSGEPQGVASAPAHQSPSFERH